MIEVRKAHELDVVELTEDLPEYGVRRGARGTVVEVFEKPEEAYMIEFLENDGEISKLADWVKPAQIKNIDLIAREFYVKGMKALEQEDFREALCNLRVAINLIPSYVRGLHNSLAQSVGPRENWPMFIKAMQLVLLLNSHYEIARKNLGIAYLNLGVQIAKSGDYRESLKAFHFALATQTSSEVVSLIKENIAASYTALGNEAFRRNEMENFLSFFGSAHFNALNETTKLNLAKAHFHYANFCADVGKLEEAIYSYQAAEDAGFMLPEVLNNHACVLAGSGRLAEAIMTFEAANSLAPHDQTIRVNLSRLLELREIQSPNISQDLIIERVEIEFPTLPMSTVPLHVAA